MRKFLLFLFLIALVFGISNGAGALDFQLDSYDVNLNTSDPGLVLDWSRINTSVSRNLALGSSVTVDLFSIWADESWVNHDDSVYKPISVAFDFSLPTSASGGPGTGTTVGGSFFWGFGTAQWGRVTWDRPATVINFGLYGDGALDVYLSDATFNFGLWGVRESERYGATVQATFKYSGEATSTTPAPVPEPATMLLLGTGLIGLAGATRKKIFKKG